MVCHHLYPNSLNNCRNRKHHACQRHQHKDCDYRKATETMEEDLQSWTERNKSNKSNTTAFNHAFIVLNVPNEDVTGTKSKMVRRYILALWTLTLIFLRSSECVRSCIPTDLICNVNFLRCKWKLFFCLIANVQHTGKDTCHMCNNWYLYLSSSFAF